MGLEGLKGGVCCTWSFKSLTRRKQVDSIHGRSAVDGHHQLAKALSATHLVAIGVGTTIGAGVYILVGTVARELSGPALMFSFLIAGIAAALSAFCYAELASRCPSAGSAYHYSYICVGEGVAWLVGWALILEYTIGGAAVARGITPNLSLLFGGHNSLPFFLARHYVPGLDVTIDPAAAILVFIATGLLCAGIKESTVAQGIVTTANVCAMLFIITAGGYLGFKTGWIGYELSSGFFPFGVNGMLAGSATVLFAYIGFDAVASTAEEVKNPKRDLPIGIGVALTICCTLYMLVSVVVVGLVPYYNMDPDTPISSAFASHGMQWAVYVITIGAVTALCSTLLGSLLPQPRVFMAMARDGLLPSFFSDVNRHTHVPVKSTIVTGICAGALAFFMEVSQLAGMVSVGTLLAFTMVAISVLILRYVPPDETPLPLSLHGSLEYVSSSSSICSKEFEAEKRTDHIGSSKDVTVVEHPLLLRHVGVCEGSSNEESRRKMAGWTITSTCAGIIILTCFASATGIPNYLRFSMCGIGAVVIVFGLVILSCIEQDEGRHNFGHSGGFLCPFVPFLPVACILVNCYLMVNLGTTTWIRVSLWLLMGVFIYAFYGRNHSTLQDAIYVPVAHADEIYRNSRKDMA